MVDRVTGDVMLKQSVWRQDTNIQTSTFTVSLLTNIYRLKSWKFCFCKVWRNGDQVWGFQGIFGGNQIPALTAISHGNNM